MKKIVTKTIFVDIMKVNIYILIQNKELYTHHSRYTSFLNVMHDDKTYLRI